MGRFPPPGFQPMARLSVDDSRLTLSVLRDIQLPPLYHRRRGLVKGFLGPAVRLPARFMDVIASHVLANALTPHVSACHCEPVPCPADTPQVSAYPTRQTLLQPQRPYLLLHVIANQCAHWCGNPRPRRETWQLGTTSGKFVCIFPYSPKVLLLVLHCRKEYGLPRRFAPRNDMLKTATRLRLQGTGAAIRIPWQKCGTLHPCPGAHIPTKPVIANQCAHLRQSASPQGSLVTWYYFGQIRMHFSVFALSTALRYVLPQGERIATSLRSSQ